MATDVIALLLSNSILFIRPALMLIIGYVIVIIVYRPYLSPLSSFPGPKFAAITSLYAMYHDIIRGGQYIWVIDEMHKQYGPIVRIRPDSVHINDPNLIDQVQGTATDRRDKSKLSCNIFMSPGAFIATQESDLHRKRRAIVSPFFSKQNIRRMEPIIQDAIRGISDRLAKHASSGIPIKINLLFKAAASDVITEYAFQESWKSLQKDDLDEPFFSVMADAPKICHFASYFPVLGNLFTGMPEGIILWLMPDMKVLIKFFSALEKQFQKFKNSIETDDSISPTILTALLDSKLPEQERASQRVLAESRVLFGAGTSTTSATLAHATFHLLSNPGMLHKLKTELEAAIPDVNSIPKLQQVHNLPYLNAIIQETLRLNPPASMRQEKVAPKDDILVMANDGKKYTIPRGTPMSMTATLLGRNEELYSSPAEFRPERYIENPQLEKFSLAFSKGPRQCIGMNLAYAQLRLYLAAIFRKYDRYDETGKQDGPTLELFETSREDIEIAADFNDAMPRAGSHGVRVVVR